MTSDQWFEIVIKLIDGIIAITKRAIPWSFAAFGIWVIAHAIVAVAGVQTDLKIDISLLAKLQIDRWIAYLVGATGATYGLSERSQKRRAIERLTKRPAELERAMDNKRSSSGLTADGRTQPRDQ